MSVIVIGNQGVGKTSMIVALAKGTKDKTTKNVRVISPKPEQLIEQLSRVQSVNETATTLSQNKFSLSPSKSSQENTNKQSEEAEITLISKAKNTVYSEPKKQNFNQNLSDFDFKNIAGTYELKAPRSLVLSVDLPSGIGKEVRVNWIDTPGEAWSKPIWRKNNPQDYQKLIETVSNSQAVILLVPPYRKTSRPVVLQDNMNPPDYLDEETWIKQLKKWLDFIRENCSNVKHFIIAIHKADLLGNDLDNDHQNWQYNREDRKLINWFNYNKYIRDTYFDAAYDIIREHNAQPPYLSPRFFITTIDNPNLLELPWVYLGSHLAYA